MLALAAGCGLPVSVISGVVLGGWDMPDGGVELSGVEPFHVLGGGQLDCVWLLLLRWTERASAGPRPWLLPGPKPSGTLGRQPHPHEDAAVTQPDAAAWDTAGTATAAPTARPDAACPRRAGLAAVITAAFVGSAIVVTVVEEPRASRCPPWLRVSLAMAARSAAEPSERPPRPAHHPRRRAVRPGPLRPLRLPARRPAVPAAPRRARARSGSSVQASANSAAPPPLRPPPRPVS